MYRAKILRKDAKVVLKPATTIHARQVAQAVNMDFATQSQCTRVAMMAQHQVYLPKGGGEAEEQIAEGYFLYMDKIAIDPHGQSGESARDIKNERNSPRRDPQPFHALIVFDWNDVLFPYVSPLFRRP